MSPAYFQRFARYNAWANHRLYTACAALPREEYHRPRPSFFGSIHATLNHLLVGDRIWFGRIAGDQPDYRLNQELCPDLESLTAARVAEDQRILDVAGALDEAGLKRVIRYTNSSGRQFADPLENLLPHIFNHQTHHRGQVHGLLSQTEVAPPELDLLFFNRLEG